MGFTIQKVLWFLVLPPSSLALVILAGLLLMDRHRRVGKIIVLSGTALLYFLSLGHVADMLVKPLESGHAPLNSDTVAADAVIVPGGGSVDLEWLGAGPVPNGESSTRLLKGIELARKLRVPLVLTGGNGEPFTTKVNDAETMAQAAYAMGMPRRQVIVENVSRNTLENSHAVRKLVKGHRIVLVTSAYYMDRAGTMFTRRGFTVIPAPVYFLGQTRKFSFASFIPRADDLQHSSVAIAEMLGLLWWRMKGEM
jgi:uncharacterized SAM-binding protein YcdF (DUF218 family)